MFHIKTAYYNKTSIIILVIFCILSGCGRSVEAPQPKTETFSLLGKWGVIFNNGCAAELTVNDDFTFTWSDGQNIFTGTYFYQVTVAEGANHPLTLTIESGNGLLEDCFSKEIANFTGGSIFGALQFLSDTNGKWFLNTLDPGPANPQLGTFNKIV